uniref:Uncharacterized protein n=1 Tax=Megaselia scalaris TaxID=36166 RepID=T1H238_MEGSC
MRGKYARHAHMEKLIDFHLAPDSAVYILNRTAKSSVEGKSPYEIFMGKKPRIKHLRIVDSLCYVHSPKHKRKKMDSKAISCWI